MTKEKVAEMAVDETVVELVAECLFREGKAQLVRERVDEYTKPVFDSFTFYVTEDCKREKGTAYIDADGRILNEKRLYLTDLDGENYKAYLTAIRKAHLENEFGDVIREHERTHNGDQGFCPALIAEHEHMIAKRNLANHVSIKWMEIGEVHYPFSDKLVDLTIGLVVNGPAGKGLHGRAMSKMAVTA